MQAAWGAILADAASKGWEAPPETSAVFTLLEGEGYSDTFYLSDNHTSGVAQACPPGGLVSEDTVKPGPTCWVVKPLRESLHAHASVKRC